MPTGRFAVAVRPVRGAVSTFAGAPASLEVEVPAGGPPSAVTAAYRPVPSALRVSAAGLPATATATFTVTSPNGSPSTVASDAVLQAAQQASGSVTPDSWLVAATDVNAEGARFTTTASCSPPPHGTG